MSDVGEREAIGRLAGIIEYVQGSLPPHVIEGIGDDCAVLDLGGSLLLITVDMISAGTNFDGSAEDAGWHLMAVNLSDIASMGGRPVGAVLALGMPVETSMDYLEGIVMGASGCAARYGVPSSSSSSRPT